MQSFVKAVFFCVFVLHSFDQQASRISKQLNMLRSNWFNWIKASKRFASPITIKGIVCQKVKSPFSASHSIPVVGGNVHLLLLMFYWHLANSCKQCFSDTYWNGEWSEELCTESWGSLSHTNVLQTWLKMWGHLHGSIK